jgi:hypothetical protein
VPDIKGAISSPISHITSKMDFELIISILLVKKYLDQSVGYYIAIIFCSYLLFFCFFSLGCFQKASILFGNQKETFHGNIIQFSFADLENATENFSASNLIGLGGSSYVYRGRLENGSNVAVKRLKNQGGPEADTEFFTEVVLNNIRLSLVDHAM